MTHWEDLPYEVVVLIAKKLSLQGKWKFVNKQLYTIHQSFQFEHVELVYSMSKYDLNYNVNINSPFQPGKWVKRRTLTHFKAPQYYEDASKLSVLHLLMKHCPNVKEVDFNYSCNAEDWYFFFNSPYGV